MVFKIFQKLPLSRASLFLQILYVFISFSLVFSLDLNKSSFLIGFVFSYLYVGLFFYSIKLIFIQRKRVLGVFFLCVKWLLLLFALILVAWFLDGKSFLLGLGAILVFLLSYVLEQMKKL